jgi:glycosyltransferase involved in cell wall biosynthesis
VSREALHAYAASRGLARGELVLTGAVTDDELRALYQRCAAFAFPSTFEGFGLPLLEAMHCGAAVVAGNNSSQPEVVGDAGLLADIGSPADLARGLAEVLSNRTLARSLGERAVRRARGFSWGQTARGVVAVLERLAGAERIACRVRCADRPQPISRSAQRTLRDFGQPRQRRRKPRIAVFSPWPPKPSGISDYATRLVGELQERYAVDLVHEGDYLPGPVLSGGDFTCVDHRVFRRVAAEVGYHAVLYQMGNSRFHCFLAPHLAKTPGVVTLHDLNLAAFHLEFAAPQGDPLGYFRREIAYCYPGQSQAIRPQLEAWWAESGGLPQALPKRGLHLNRRVIEQARAVVVHSPWCVEQVRRDDPRLAEKLTVIPLAAAARRVSPVERAATRRRFGIPADALVFGSFGFLSRSKLNVEALSAFRAVAAAVPESLFVFAGDDLEGGEAARAAEWLGVANRVRFLGRVTDADFADLAAATDVGVCLRRPPTYGETSAALLDLLRHGVATVTTDAGTFDDFPDGVVRKVRWSAEGQGGLDRALLELATQAWTREALGSAAFRYVSDRHSWSSAADTYAELLDRAAGEDARPGAA